VSAGRRNLAVIFLSNAVASMGMAAFLPAFPIILPKLGITEPHAVSVWTGVLTAAAPLSAAISGPLWGALGDRVGRKMMVLRALLGLAAFVGVMTFVTNPWVLLLLRFGQGTFSGFIAPSLTFVSVHTDPAKQGRVAAYLQLALLLGSIVGPPLGGKILDHGSPAGVFALAAISALFSAVVVSAFARETVPPAARPGSGSNFSAATRDAIRDVRLTLAEPLVVRLLVAVFAVRFGVSCVEPLFANVARRYESTSVFMQENFGLANGALYAATGVGNLVALPFWGHRGDRHGHRSTLVLSALVAGVCYAPQALAPEPWSLFVIRLLCGVFLAGVVPSAYGLMAAETPLERRGSAYSLTFSAIALANSFAPVLGGILVDSIGIDWLIALSALPMVLAGMWAARWPRTIAEEEVAGA